MRTSNPILNDSSFEQTLTAGARMTLQGTVNKSFLLIGVLLIPALYVFRNAEANPEMTKIAMYGGLIAGLILALITSFKAVWSPVTAPLYAAAEGCFLGGLSAFFEARYPGIAIQAILLTCGTFLALLAVYSMRVIKVTENFKMGVLAATGGVFLVYLASWILSFFGIQIPFIHESGLIGIGFSVFVVVLAALNLVLDFDFIENGCQQGAPKYMEWYASFGLLVTLVWLYVEILRLLAKLNSRD